MRVLLMVGLVLSLTTNCRPENEGDGDGDGDGDGEGDGDADVETCDLEEVECCEDIDCTDSLFCNGLEVCDNGYCETDPEAIMDPSGQIMVNCDDGIACTIDDCDEQANRCVHNPGHDSCDNGDFCDGEERCIPTEEDADPSTGCVLGSPVRCDDGDQCTDDYCEEGECMIAVRDADLDGHGDQSCTICTDLEDPESCESGDDCDDNDDTVYPGADEICSDGKDNDCDGYRDYAEDECNVPNDSCEDALSIEDDGVIFSSTRGTSGDINTDCTEDTDRDVAFHFTLAEVSDVAVSIIAGSSRVSASLTASCGDPGEELRCSSGREIVIPARGLSAGTYYVVVETEAETDFSISLATSPASPGPDGDLCTTALPLAPDGSTHTVSLTGARFDYELSCIDPGALDMVYEFNAPAGFTGDITVSRTSGAGLVAFSLQESCGLMRSERRCWSGDTPVTARLCGLLAGTYYLVVANDIEVDYEITAVPSEPVAGIHFEEDFTSDPTARGWTLSGDWTHGTPTDPVPDDGSCISTSMSGSYVNSMEYTDDYAETPPIDLSESCAPTLHYRAWLETENCCDGAHLEISVDGGAFAVLEHDTLAPPYNDSAGSQPVWQSSNDYNFWNDYSVSLEEYVGSEVRIRFAFRSDFSMTYSGWYVDNMTVIEP